MLHIYWQQHGSETRRRQADSANKPGNHPASRRLAGHCFYDWLGIEPPGPAFRTGPTAGGIWAGVPARGAHADGDAEPGVRE